MESILITGSNGFVGQAVTNSLLKDGFSVTGISLEKNSIIKHVNFTYHSLNLNDCILVENFFQKNNFSHVIHLSALAHVTGEKDLSWNRYYRNNVLCSKTVFSCSTKKNIPIFFSSTIDVYGIQDIEITPNTPPNPVGNYAKPKIIAEKLLLDLKNESVPFLIARFAPIYSNLFDRDIQKRYYIKSPSFCYLINDGIDYEFLHIDNAVKVIGEWVKNPRTRYSVVNVRDPKRLNTKDLVRNANEVKRIIFTIYVPYYFITFIKYMVKQIFKKNSMLKLKIYKIVTPYKTDAYFQKILY